MHSYYINVLESKWLAYDSHSRDDISQFYIGYAAYLYICLRCLGPNQRY